MILEQVTSISNPLEVMLNRKVIQKCHITIAIDRTFTIALPERNGCSLISPNPCAFKNKPI